MSFVKAYMLRCDVSGCDQSVEVLATTWRHRQIVAEMRRRARDAGWLRTRDGRDICRGGAHTAETDGPE